MDRTVRNDLGTRLAALRARADRASCGELASDLEAIRRIATAHGMTPTVTVVHALAAALARGERGPLVQGWLTILGDAIGCERHDRATDAAFAALCSVRQAR